MKQNLDSLRDEIQRYLETEGFVVFHGFSRSLESSSFIRWNTRLRPDYHGFLEVAQKVGAPIIVFYAAEFDTSLVDEALEDLEGADLPREEKREYERRLREMRLYEGFTYEIELSFDHQGRTYVYKLATDWYNELNDIMDEIDSAVPEEEEDNPLGGYYFNN
jgi:hypothetical protein